VPTPTRPPTPAPAAIPTDGQLIATCNWSWISSAAKYAGKIHPLAVVYNDKGWYVDSGFTYSINNKWLIQSWGSPIQLVVCVGARSIQKVGSCGTYTRASDGARGQLLRYKLYKTVRVAIAKTGKTLQSKTFYGSTPSCSQRITLPDDHAPPWQIYGSEVDDNAINAYATAVSTQK
jgi:hypothetical protein